MPSPPRPAEASAEKAAPVNATPAADTVGPPAPAPAETPFDAPLRNVQETAVNFSSDALNWVSKSTLDAGLAICVALVVVLGLHVARNLGMRMLARNKTVTRGWRSLTLRLLRRTSVIYLTVLGCWAVANYITMPPGVMLGFRFALTILSVIQMALWLREVVLWLIDRRLSRQGTEGDENALSGAMEVLTWMLNLVVWSIALLLILDNLGVNVTALVAGLGIGGLAIGLAAQGVMGDLFSALSIVFDKPFVKGDVISFGSEMGAIERVGLKATRIRALSGEQIIVSNAQLLSATLHNYRRMLERRAVFRFAVSGDTLAEAVKDIPSFVREALAAEPDCRLDRTHLIAIGDRGFEFETVYFFKDSRYNPYMDANQRILLHIIRLCQERQVSFAAIQMPFGRPGIEERSPDEQMPQQQKP